jgi:uncharacterized protein
MEILKAPHIPTLKVSGTGFVLVRPNKGEVTVGVVTDGKSLSTIQAENGGKTKNIIESLQQLGVLPDQIKTIDYRIDPVYEYKENTPFLKGYKITHLLQINISNIAQTGTIIDTAVKNGANTVSDIRFDVAQKDVLYNKALQKAYCEAQKKAIQLGNVMGVRINPIPYSVIEQFEEVFSPPRYALAAAESTPIQTGRQKITAKVHVEFTFY